MKRIIICLFLFLTIALSIQSQKNKHGRIKLYETDIFGTLKHQERNGFSATFSKNIFDDKLYEDSRGNKMKYSKKVINKLQQESGSSSDNALFDDLIAYFKNKKDVSEEFEIDIFDNLKYKNNARFKASLSKNIFGDIVYEDSNGNQLKYEQKFLDYYQLYLIKNQGVYLFMDLLYPMIEVKNYREEYKINIFDQLEYKNSEGVKIELDAESARKHYTRGRKEEREFLWNRFLNDYGK